MKLWKITLSGLRGRKKDTRLLWLVVTLAYLFITLSTTVIASMQTTEETQRGRLYGGWQVMASRLRTQEADTLLARAQGVSTRVLGTNQDFGVVGTFSEELAQTAGFELLEGRYPENDDELLIESKQLVACGRDLQVGDSVTLSIPMSLYLSPRTMQLRQEMLAQMEQERMEAAQERAQAYIDDLAASGELEEIVDSIFKNRGRMHAIPVGNWGMNRFWLDEIAEQYDYIVSQHPEGWAEEYGLPEDMAGRLFDELPQELQRQVVIDGYRDSLFYYEYGQGESTHPIRINNLLSRGDITLRTQTETVTGQEEIHGNVDVWVQKTYTLVGVIETYSDRWDCGNVQLPNVFITQEMGHQCEEALEEVYAAYPYLERREVGDSLVFFREENASPEELFLRLMPVYNGFVQEDAQVYSVGYSGDDTSGFAPLYFDAVNEADGKTVSITAYHDGENAYCFEWWDQNARKSVLYTVEPEEMFAGTFTIAGAHPPVTRAQVTEQAMEDGGASPLRINRYAYPLSESGSFMLVIVVAVLFVTTMAAVLQIFITQIRRRMQRIALMKAIGTTNRQTGVMLFFEFLFFLVTTLPVGVGLGLLGAWGAVQALGASRGEMLFSVQPAVVLAGMAAGTLALFLGMAVPGVMALRIPLTGRMTVTAKAPVHRRKETARRQTFLALVRRNLQANRSRTLGNAALSVFICTIAVLCTYIGYGVFEDYRTGVEWADKPDYVLTVPAAMSRRGAQTILDDLQGVGEIERIDVINAGLNIGIAFDGMEDSRFIQALAEESGDHYGDFFSRAEDGSTLLYTDLYTVQTDSDVYRRLNAALSVGHIDETAFKNGEEVILFIPMYRIEEEKEAAPVSSDTLAGVSRQDAMRVLLEEGGRTSVSARSWAPYALEAESALQVGDTLRLLGETVRVSEESVNVTASEANVRVGGIIYYFPGEGVWPLSQHMRSYSVIGSDAALSQVYPRAPRAYSLSELSSFMVMNEIYFEDTFGRTYIQLYANPSATRENTDFYLDSFARDHALELTVYRESNRKVYNAAQNAMLLAAFLGFAAVLLSMLILDNAVASTLEQERGRMGILQSMGITGRQFVQQQLYAGGLYAGIGLGVAHVVWLLAVAVFTLVNGGAACTGVGGFFACLTGQSLWRYPWGIHIGICLLCAALCVLLQVLPMVRLLHYKPIENIKFRK